MNILLVYPETPPTFWSFRNAIRFISKKSTEPPLGLITVAAMLPDDWSKKLIDLNITKLSDRDLHWADYLFITGMNIHRESFKKVVRRANQLGIPVVAGGPMVTANHDEFLGIDHFVLNEAEITLKPFIEDLLQGRAKAIYRSTQFPDITAIPRPMWELLDRDKYASMSVQYSRGCPFDCDFCNITMLNGHKPRTKSSSQFIHELQSLYDSGWRGDVFVVDDNFIGNKKKIKKDLLPALIEWSESHRHPFSFGTETSINLADDEELMGLMARAGFDHTFVGIESPNGKSLAECGKKQNLNRNMLDSVQRMHRSGLRVSGGFIIGFDSDPADIFEQQIHFIRNSGIVTAMVGLLNAPTGTRLFKRLKAENRMLNTLSGDNMDGSINFIPRMPYQKLVAGYKQVLETIYNPREYYNRVCRFLNEYQPRIRHARHPSLSDIRAFLRTIWVLGLRERGRIYYWKLLFLSLFKFPAKFPMAITMAIYGFHFREVVKSV